jgi:hypothetical protein
MAGQATIHAHRRMLEHERSAFIGVAIHTGLFVGFGVFHMAGTGSIGPGGLKRSMRIVAIGAVHEAFVYAMFEGHGKLGLHIQMAAGTQGGLSFGQQSLGRRRIVNGMAIGADHVIQGVGGTADVGA